MELRKTILIGDQLWSQENLRVTSFVNGDEIPQAFTAEEWIKASKEKTPAYCVYGYPNDDSNWDVYGLLYNWYAVNDPRGLAPKGWRIPTEHDWKELGLFLEKNYWKGKEGIALKADSELWEPYEGCYGEDIYSFKGLPSGWRYESGDFEFINAGAGFWSSTEANNHGMTHAHIRILDWMEENWIDSIGEKGEGYAIRCIKNMNVVSS